MRIHAMTYVRMLDPYHHVYVLLNDGRYVPIRGTLQTTRAGVRHLKQWGAQFEDPTTLDLRLTLPADKLEQACAWFLGHKQRVTSPLPTIQRKLVAGQLLSQRDAARPRRCKCVHHDVQTRRETSRPGVQERRTTYFREVVEVQLNPNAMRRLAEISCGPSKLYAATDREISAGRAVNGRLICNTAKLLLPPWPGT